MVAKTRKSKIKNKGNIAALSFLVLLFLAVLGTRLFFVFQMPKSSEFQTQKFSDDKSYFVLRQIEEILNTKQPIYNDVLSYGGKLNQFLPLYYFILSFFSIFMPLNLAAKVIPNIFASLMVLVSYPLFLKLTKSKTYSLISAGAIAFIPAFFSETLNSISVNSLFIPVLCFAIYCFINIEKGIYVKLYIASIIFLSLLSSNIFILVISLLLYVLLVKLQNLKQDRREVELILFTIFFVLWASFLFFKKALLFHGISFVFQNIPRQLLANFFSELTILKAVYKVGVIPLLVGVFMIYRGIVKKNRQQLLLVSFAISTTLLLWFKLIPLNTGLVFLGIALSLFFADFLKYFFNYIKKTKASKFRILFYFIVFLLIALTLVSPSISDSKDVIEDTPKTSLIKALNWFRYNSDENATLLSILEDGNKITYFANRKNVIDSNFLLVDDISQRYEDIETIYKTRSEVEAIRLMNKYDVDYILFSYQIRKKFRLEKLNYVDDADCFHLVYDHLTEIYRLTCTVEDKK